MAFFSDLSEKDHGMVPFHQCIAILFRGRPSKTGIGLALLAAVALSGFSLGRTLSAGESGGIGSAWAVEWDLDGWKETAALGDALEYVQIFAASFDADDKPVIADDLAAWIGANAEQLREKNAYLTVVNDAVRKDGEVVAKDPDLISRLMAGPESRKKHREDLLALLGSGNFSGLDIDYERVKLEDWPTLLAFCQELHKELEADGKGLRVVIEPKKAYLEKPLPAGPEYSLMAYNLFGGHSGPGPKATPAFIGQLASYCRAGKNKVRLALSTGGFLWREGDRTRGITEQQAVNLAAEHNAVMKRDSASRYLLFSYTDGEGKKCTVWYADADALATLIKRGKTFGFDRVDIWRLGGMTEKTLSGLAKELGPKQTGKTHRVGRGRSDAFPTVSAAIAAAGAGDTIVVDPGVYEENIRVDKPGLTITAPPGQVASIPVTIAGKAGSPVLEDGYDTEWAGFFFSKTAPEELVVLDNFTGSFAHCGFTAAKGGPELVAVRVLRGAPTFNACSFTGDGGSALGLSSAALADGQANSLVDITYCLFQGFAENVAIVSDDVDVRFANCLFTKNGLLALRQPQYRGDVEIANSVLFHNVSPYVTSNAPGADDIRMTNCLYTPVLNHLLWVVAEAPVSQAGVAAENCLPRSPRFRAVGRDILLNLGIDDTSNVGVWEALAKEADQYGYKTTFAINTAVAVDEDWRRIRATFDNGHEIGSHTASHASVQIDPPISVGFSRKGVRKAALTIDKDKGVVIAADGKPAVSIPTDDLSFRIIDLSRQLAKAGVPVQVSPFHAGVPAKFLAPATDLDISFPNAVVPLYLDTQAFLDYELSRSKRDIEEHFPELEEIAFINPFATNSPLAKTKIRQFGFAAARSNIEDEAAGITDGIADATVEFNIFNIPCKSIQSTREMLPENDVLDNFLLLLDYIKLHFTAFSFYSHTYQELTLDQWRDLLALVRNDPKLKVRTLVEIAEQIKAEGTDMGDGVYSYRLDAPTFDFRPQGSSPMLGAGVSLGLATDFAGNPVPFDRPPNIGLYQ